MLHCICIYNSYLPLSLCLCFLQFFNWYWNSLIFFLDLSKSYLSKSGLLLLIMMFNYGTLVFFRCGPENWFSFSRVSVEFQPSFVVVVSYDYPHVFSSCMILNEGLSRRSFLVSRKLITAFMPFYYFLVLHQIWLNILTDGIIVSVDNCNWIQSI